MTSWWEVVTVAVAALGSGLIGALIGMHLAQRDADDRLGPFLSTPDPGRKATAYFEVAVGWHAYLESVRPLAFPTEGFAVDRPRDLAAVLRARAQLEQFGTATAQRLHDDALEAAVALINILRSLPKSPASGQPDLVAGRPVLRVALRDLAVKVDQLERQMQVELLPPPPPPPDSYVEITGRAGVARGDRAAAPESAAPASR